MMERPFCEDKERLIAYVYGDGDDTERREMAEHVESCFDCMTEIEALQGVRQNLAEWTPPRLAPDFEVIRAKPARRFSFWPSPAWGFATAAAVVLMATIGIARLEMRFDGDTLVVRSGWAGEPQQAATTGVGSDQWRRELVGLERRLRDEMTNTRRSEAPVMAAAAVTPSAGESSDAALLRRMRGLIDDSEKRQQQELALRMTQVVQDVDRQRQVDLIRIQQGLGRLEGQTDAEAARQREILNYLMRVSQRP